ncbi:MAG TPA: flagellar basal body P-ring formation chaperone FlgA [Steroidobacteraceae bacterium]|nr:flagellar basal body P-ring formation chaperone FlgA [Steroidobacteraceae bacterium]
MRNRHLATFALAVLASFPVTLAVSSDGGTFQSLADVEQAARHFAAGAGPQAGARRQTQIAALDSRLRLAACQSPLQTSLAPGARSPTRLTVQVRCADAGGWRVYVPVEVHYFDHVVVASRSVDRGATLAPADLLVEERDTSSLPSSYMRDPAELTGFTLARPVAAGTVISSSLLAADHVIRRGDMVTLIAQSGGMTVRAQGRALADAAMRERVRVQNLGSGRQIEGVAVGAGLVEVSFH